MGRALYALVRLALMRVLPVLRGVKRARLAIQGQPSPSKPVIPEYAYSIPRTVKVVYLKDIRLWRNFLKHIVNRPNIVSFVVRRFCK